MGIGLRQIGKWVQRGRSRCYAAKNRLHKADLVPELHKADFGECLEAKTGPQWGRDGLWGPKEAQNGRKTTNLANAANGEGFWGNILAITGSKTGNLAGKQEGQGRKQRNSRKTRKWSKNQEIWQESRRSVVLAKDAKGAKKR